MKRDKEQLTVTIEDGESTSDVAFVSVYTMFMVYVPSGTAGTHLQFLEDYDGDPAASADEDEALKIVGFTAGRWQDAPVACALMHRMHIRTCSANDGTAQTQTSDVTLTIRGKA